jgi:diguanylate cyclase (GGDEF)-like protein
LPQIHFGEQAMNMVSLSAGIACMPEHGATARELLRAADQAMYTAKQAGKDRIVVHQKAITV